ncbi:hypothetical protein SPRG_11037 [Saprolegnia parasitica CBS 223.65]|uniref:Uncharacterized protein n=1 Tax=Saprolegnia parasitica (strain CBS 223.65) TaxID=695850 RepID=A0A067BSH5_SAPPC|nr:hypothetical protein SPRG_11037 [Saprolegnia parasitica CBS 223.65]KDO21178.1 hypothetical protein SPRG_11037 [Saprolegnia parasitica CBS 223.65]|eukprot:XP_012208089.1 hypothetical protein SPRG_11037 [Saprolegnia parasitica CBS 223.65]
MGPGRMWAAVAWALCVLVAATAPPGLSTSALLEELARTDAQLASQQQKLTLLHGLRRALTSDATLLPHVQAELQAVLARLKAPGSCEAMAPSTEPSVGLLVERPLLILPSAPVLLHSHRVVELHRSTLLLLTLTDNGVLGVSHLPGGQPVASVMLPEAPNVVVTAATVDSDASPMLLYAFLSNQSLSTFSVAIILGDSGSAHVNITRLSTVATATHGAMQQLHLASAPGQKLLVAGTESTFHVLPVDASYLKTMPTSAPIAALLPHRHVIAVASETRVDLHHLLKLGDGPSSVYSCDAGLFRITSVAFDASVVSRLYAATTSGDILVFDVFHGSTRSCRAIARVGTSASGPLRLRAIAPSFLLAASKDALFLFETTSSLTLLGATPTRPVEIAAMHVSVVPSVYNGEFYDDALLVTSAGRAVHTYQASLHRHEATKDSTLWFGDSVLGRFPLLVLLAIAIVAYKMWSRPGPSVAPRSAFSTDYARPTRGNETDEVLHPDPPPYHREAAYVDEFATAQKRARQRLDRTKLERDIY